MKKVASRSEAGRKAARTKELRGAGRKAALTRKRREAGRKAATTTKQSLKAASAHVAKWRVTAADLAAIERHLHAAILGRAQEFRLQSPAPLPVLAQLKLDGKGWFPVRGMYGGFAYAWDRSANEPTLLAHSWSRVADATQRHVITAAGVETVDEEDGPTFVLVEDQ